MKHTKSLFMIVVLSLSILGMSSSAYAGDVVEVNIMFDQQIDHAFLDQLNADIKHEFNSLQGVSVTIPTQALRALDARPSVSWEYNTEVQLLSSIDWGVDRVDAERVWGGSEDATNVIDTCGSSVRVAVIDTGIDIDHPDLNFQGGYDFVNNDNNPNDGNGHGTHVAGTIAAIDNGAGLVGVAPCVELYGVKVLSDSGSGTSADVAAGIEWAANNNMDIASLSLGSSAGSSVIRSAGQYAASQGVLLIAASGNDGASSVGYPARYSEFMAVGATDQNDNVASFSNRGSNLEISAPGVSIQSTYPGGGYRSLSGTSMATPHVSAVAALVMSADSSLSASQVRSILQDTAEDVNNNGWDSSYGYGIVDAEAAVAATSGGGGGGGGGAGAVELSVYTYDWDISGEINFFVNGYELNWESQGLASNNGYKTYTFDISSIAGDFLDIEIIDTYNTYNNDFRDLIVYVDGAQETNLQSSWVEPTGAGESYTYSLGGGGGGGSDTFSISIYTYDWDIAGEVNFFINGVELNWESQGVAGDASYKTFTFDITSIAGSSLDITLIDTYGSYTNYFRNLIVYRNGVAESNLQSSWLETPGSGVSYTYNL